MLKMVDGTGIIGVDMVCPLGGAVSPPQPPNYDNIEMDGMGSLTLPNSLKAPIERLELLGNSTQGENPSPDNPQEIKSAGRKSRNLFDINYFKDKSNLQIIQCEGFSLLGIICNVKPNTNYTLSANITEAQYNLNIANKTQRFSLTSSSARTLMSNDDGTLYIGLFNTTTADAVNMDDFMQQYKNIQLEEGDAATYYEPYSDKYLLDVKVTGKNLFDIEKAKNLYNWEECPVMPTYKDFPIYIGKGNKFSLSFHENLKNMKSEIVVAVALVKSSGINKWLYDGGNNFNNAYIETAKEDYIYIRSNKKRIHFFTNDIKTLQVEINPVPTEYQPYTEQTVQIALDEPLRGIGEYKDTITKDGIVRKICDPYEIDLNSLKDGGYQKPNTVLFYFKAKSKAVTYTALKQSIICNTLPDCAIGGANIFNKDAECIAVAGINIWFRILKSRLKDTSNFEAIKQSFIEHMADKKMIVEHAIETPVTEPLPESVQAQLSALHSENGTTHVFVDSGEVPCGIKLTYRKEK